MAFGRYLITAMHKLLKKLHPKTGLKTDSTNHRFDNSNIFIKSEEGIGTSELLTK